MQDWFLLYTKPRSEGSIAHRLCAAGFETLNPMTVERRLYRRKIADIVSPLFPCYLFARFDKFRDYHLIRYTRGIKRVLTNEDGPAPVAKEIIASIEARMDSRGLIEVRTSFTPGESVILKGGPFEGLEAVFEKEMRGIERVSILLKAVGARVIVDGRLLARL